MISASDLLSLLRELPLLPAGRREQLGSVTAACLHTSADATTLAATLVERNWLTSYQVKELLAGRGRDLILDQHVLLEPLGTGGMGQVFKARHQRLDRLEAIKLLRPEHLETPEAVQRFQREARAAARLDHPHIVRVHDSGEVDGRHFLAMEYVQGIDLDRHIEDRGALSPRQVIGLLTQVARGLQHAHENGLVHRDIKPQNLLLVRAADPSAPVQVKILDFGLARLQSLQTTQVGTSLTPSGMIIGTPDYMAPEQAPNHRLTDIRSDLYSLGCTAYHLLVGHPPFLGGGMMEKLLRHQAETPPPLERNCPEVPAELAALVTRLMEKDPDQRFQTPEELLTALQTLDTTRRAKVRRKVRPRSTPQVSLPLSANSVPPRKGLSETAGWLLAGGVGALVILVLALAFWWLRTR